MEKIGKRIKIDFGLLDDGEIEELNNTLECINPNVRISPRKELVLLDMDVAQILKACCELKHKSPQVR